MDSTTNALSSITDAMRLNTILVSANTYICSPDELKKIGLKDPQSMYSKWNTASTSITSENTDATQLELNKNFPFHKAYLCDSDMFYGCIDNQINKSSSPSNHPTSYYIKKSMESLEFSPRIK